MIYRHANAADVPQVLRVVSLMVEGTMFQPPTERKLARFIADAASYHQGVWLGERLIAFMCGTISETFLNDEVNAYEKGLFVLPEHRGGSISVRLVRNFEEWAKQAGATNIWLGQSVGQNMESTLRFFERLGYACQGFTTCKKL